MNSTFDPFDELAAMFLTVPPHVSKPMSTMTAGNYPARSPSNGSKMRPKATMELLLVGHLPVRAGLWLTPYADAVARQSGPTALLRLDGEQPSLQLLRGTADLPRSAHADHSLRDAIDELAAVANVWTVRAQSGTPTIELMEAGADRFTILSAVDEAAIVAAYQLIKDLNVAAVQSGRTLPSVAFAAVGADAATVAPVIERLSRTAMTSLGVEIKLALCLPRMDAGVRSTRCEMFSTAAAPKFLEVFGWVAAAKQRALAASETLEMDVDAMEMRTVEKTLRVPTASPPRPATAASSSTAPPYRPPLRIELGAEDDETVGATRPVEPAATGNPRSFESKQTPPLPRPFKLVPKPAMRWEPKPVAAPVIEPVDHGKPVPLASFVNGLTLLPVRSPGHERVEVAVDSAGRMHLLAREQSLRELQIVENWVHMHRELIAMACPQHTIDHAQKTISHVFSAEPITLSDLHQTTLRLHVLAPVTLGDLTAWYAAPLNASGR